MPMANIRMIGSERAVRSSGGSRRARWFIWYVGSLEAEDWLVLFVIRAADENDGMYRDRLLATCRYSRERLAIGYGCIYLMNRYEYLTEGIVRVTYSW